MCCTKRERRRTGHKNVILLTQSLAVADSRFLSCDNSVGMGNMLEDGRRRNLGSIPWRGRGRFSKTTRIPLELVQPLIGDTGNASPGIQRPEREVHH